MKICLACKSELVVSPGTLACMVGNNSTGIGEDIESSTSQQRLMHEQL
jgi:hypothetical protein